MIRIITDSAADFSAEELRQYGLTMVPLQVTFGEDTYEDGVTLTPEIFWSRIMSGENPKTSQPSPDAFLTVFEEAKAAGDSVLCVLLSSALSGTVQSATLARSMADYDDIHIVDSLQAATAEKMLVLRACQLRDEGKLSAAEMAEALRSFTKRIKLYACLDTLDYLARGGRIPQAAASLGSLVQLKVIVHITEEGKGRQGHGPAPRQRRRHQARPAASDRYQLPGAAAVHLSAGQLPELRQEAQSGRHRLPRGGRHARRRHNRHPCGSRCVRSGLCGG